MKIRWSESLKNSVEESSSFGRREFLMSGTTLAAASMISPTGVLGAISSQVQVRRDPIMMVAPEFRAPLMQFLGGEYDVPMNAQTLERIRAEKGDIRPTPQPAVMERLIPGHRGGASDVQVFVINSAASDTARPAVLHMHGGGFVAGTAASRVPSLQQIALQHDCVIVTVDYRLAPETHYPGSLEDNYSALKWLHAEAQSLGVDSSRIALMGESAGGGHAAMLAIAARDRGEAPIAFQVLIYPMLDDRTGSTRVMPPHIGAYVWVPASNRFGWSSLLGVPAGSRVVPAGSVPARVENLAGLPPAFIGVGSVDLFVDEDIEYAARLIDAGVATQLCVVPGGYHGFDLIAPHASGSVEFAKTWNAALSSAFAPKIHATDG